jgi:hypothetical protein
MHMEYGSAFFSDMTSIPLICRLPQEQGPMSVHRSDVFRPENTPLNGILAVELEHGNRISIFDLTCLNMLLSRQYHKSPVQQTRFSRTQSHLHLFTIYEFALPRERQGQDIDGPLTLGSGYSTIMHSGYWRGAFNIW